MIQIPYAVNKRTSYENFEAECPHCGTENIFNRASDLKRLNPIDFLEVYCQNQTCCKPFYINGDLINSAPEMLIFDCHELLKRKKYMNVVLNLTQAYEVFFSLYLRVELIYKPYATDTDKDIDHLNRIVEILSEKLINDTFVTMRQHFMNHFFSGCHPRTLCEAETTVNSIKKTKEQNKEISDDMIESLQDKELVVLLKALKETTINKLRNTVVHKQAYRPTLHEVEDKLKEARSIIPYLVNILDLVDDVNHYME